MIQFKVLICGALTLLILVMGYSSGAAEETELIIQTKDQVYLAEESIWIDVLVINHSQNTVTVPIPSVESGGLALRVFENGEPNYRKFGKSISYFELPTHELAPGDTLYNQIDFSETFPISNVSSRENYVPLTGEIAVIAGCANGIRSDTLRFTIVEPTDTEKEASMLIDKGAEHFYSEAACSYYVQVIDMYPNSAYASKACQMLINDYILRDPLDAREKMLQYSRLILSDYLETGDILLALSVLKACGKSQEMQEVVNTLANSESLRHRMIAKAVREKTRMR
jgi:hypothetical protein